MLGVRSRVKYHSIVKIENAKSCFLNTLVKCTFKEVPMKSSFKKISIIASVLLSCFMMAFPQTIPTGKLDGTINDDQGLPLPGVSISISSPSLILPQMNTNTNEKGYYRFVGLPSGVFTVKCDMPGFKTVVREGIVVTAGRTTTLSLIMEPSKIEETVVVRGQAPLVDLQNTATGITLDSQALDNLPIARTVGDLANLAPGMWGNAAHGSDILVNKTTVDGMIVTNPLHGVMVNEIGFSAIEEITIDTAMHKAEHGGVKGAVVQIITKSGGNKFEGDIGGYYQEKSFQADNTKGTPFEGQFVGFKYEFQPFFALGGPIKKDKIWFFTSIDLRLYRYYVEGYPYDTQPTNLACDTDRYRPFGKLTWQISPSDKFVASLAYSENSLHHSGASRYVTEKGTFVSPDGGWTASVQWSKTFSSNLFYSARLGWFNRFEDRYAKTKEGRVYDEITRLYSGGQSFDHWNRRDRVQLFTDATYFIDDWFGSHEIKAGGNADYSWNEAKRIHIQNPMFEGRYPGFKVYQIRTRNGVPSRLDVSEDYDRFENVLNLGLFVQDTWVPSNRLVFSLGLRLDHSEQIWPRQKKIHTDIWNYEKTTIPMKWTTLSPRLGVNFDLSGNGKTVLRGSVGRYYAALTTMLTNYVHKSAPTTFSVMINPDYSERYQFNRVTPSGALDEDLKAYYNDEILVGIEREIIKDLSLGVSYIWKWEKNFIEGVDANHIDIEDIKAKGIENREPIWHDYSLVPGTDPQTGKTVYFYSISPSNPNYDLRWINIPGTIRKYRALELKINKRMSNHWAMNASYVWAKARGLLDYNQLSNDTNSNFFNEPNIHINAWGDIATQREHFIKIQGTYQAPFGIDLSTVCFLYSGSPYGRYLRTTEAGVKLYQGTVSILVEPIGTYQLPWIYDLNFRAEKSFRLGAGRIRVQADVFRVLNSNTTTSIGTVTNVDWQKVLGILGARYFRLGLIYSF